MRRCPGKSVVSRTLIWTGIRPAAGSLRTCAPQVQLAVVEVAFLEFAAASEGYRRSHDQYFSTLA
jgi:hypothetical protein